MDELELLANADERARMYTTAIGKRRVFPDGDALANLALFDEPLPEHGVAAADVLRLLDEAGSPATVASNDPALVGVSGGKLCNELRDYAWQRSAPQTRSAASNRTFATLGYDMLESRSWNKRASIQFHLQTEVSQWALSVWAV
jgi:hypothetical protein